MQYAEVDIKELNAAFYNPRKTLTPKDKEFMDIRTSLGKYGFVEPLIVNSVNNRVIGGNQRYVVAKEMGLTQVPVVYVTIEDEQKEKALCIALNKITGRWDNTKLTALLNELFDMGTDIASLGFNESEMTNLLNSVQIETAVTKSKGELEHKLSNVVVAVATYLIKLTQEEYTAALDQLRIEAGYDEKKIPEILKHRLLGD